MLSELRDRIAAHSLLSLRSCQRQRREQRARAIAHPGYAWQRTVPAPLLRRLCEPLEAA